MDVLDLLDEAVTKSWDTDDPFFVIDHDKIRALIYVAKAARDLRSDIARTVDLSLDWSYDPERETAAISTVVDSNHLMAFVKALTKLGGGDG